MHDDELLDIKEVCRFIGGSRPLNPATVYRGIQAGRFSRPIKLGPFTARWRKSELQADIERLAAERDVAAA
jgi:predicted DNA-binding transcriptional regulator AlpA